MKSSQESSSEKSSGSQVAVLLWAALVSSLEQENQQLFDKLNKAEGQVSELECTVQDLNEKYGNRG